MREQICTKFWEATSDEHGKEPHGTYHGDSREAISDEHGLDQHGTYHGDYDLQLERTTAIPTCSLSASMQTATKQLHLWTDRRRQQQSERALHRGTKLIDSILDVVRKEAQGCYCLQYFQLCHSLPHPHQDTPPKHTPKHTPK